MVAIYLGRFYEQFQWSQLASEVLDYLPGLLGYLGSSIIVLGKLPLEPLSFPPSRGPSPLLL